MWDKKLAAEMDRFEKEKYRYRFAGMAMQAMASAIWSDKDTEIAVGGAAKRRGYRSVRDLVAFEAVEYADSLIKALEEEE